MAILAAVSFELPRPKLKRPCCRAASGRGCPKLLRGERARVERVFTGREDRQARDLLQPIKCANYFSACEYDPETNGNRSNSISFVSTEGHI